MEDEQKYCDWCYGPLSEEARRRSRALGLPFELSWACVDCLDAGCYRQAPDGWNPDERAWPSRNIFELSDEEVRAAANALNEVLHGPEAIDEWEFQTRLGVTQEQALAVLRKITPIA